MPEVFAKVNTTEKIRRSKFSERENDVFKRFELKRKLDEAWSDKFFIDKNVGNLAKPRIIYQLNLLFHAT